MKSRFWSSDWFAGLLITIAVVIFSGSASFQSLERSAYDWGVRSTDRTPSDKVTIIAIDDESIANIGRWPWPRDLHAELINRLGPAELNCWRESNISSWVFSRPWALFRH